MTNPQKLALCGEELNPKYTLITHFQSRFLLLKFTVEVEIQFMSIIATIFVNAYLSDSQKDVESGSTDSLEGNKFTSNDGVRRTDPSSPPSPV